MANNTKLMNDFYLRKIAENEMHLKFWEDYLNGLNSLNFNNYIEKLSVPILVPIGNKIYFRGELKHTNEVTVSLGTEYFVKCSVAQAEILRQHRIKDVQTKVDLYRKEKEHLESNISFTKQNVFNKEGEEILEFYTEEEENVWRQKHRENVRKYKQEEKEKRERMPTDDINDQELWEKLEELELQEELENEMLNNYNEITDKRKNNTFLINEKNLLLKSFNQEKREKHEEEIQNKYKDDVNANTFIQKEQNTNIKEIEIIQPDNVQEQSSQQELLQKVLEKQNELQNKLHELKYREREQSKTEQDLISKLDEIEQLEELEDEVERLDDILETENVESDSDLSNSDSTKLKKSICFAGDDQSDTIQIYFEHSDTVSNDIPYNPDTGITKPSDLYEAYSNLFSKKPTSILKKTKYGPKTLKNNKPSGNVAFEETSKINTSPDPEHVDGGRTIIIKDVVETLGVNQHNIEGGARPTSLFKKKRMQNRS